MDHNVDDHEVISSERLYDGKVVGLQIEKVRLPDGRFASWETVTHPGAVGIVPLLSDRQVVLVKQYRHATRQVLLEIPAGKLDMGLSPEETAARELQEEVQLKAGRLLKLAEFYNSPGFSDEYFHLFLALDLSVAPGEPEEDEFLEVVRLPLDEAIEMVAARQIIDAKTIIGLSLAEMYARGAFQVEAELPDGS